MTVQPFTVQGVLAEILKENIGRHTTLPLKWDLVSHMVLHALEANGVFIAMGPRVPPEPQVEPSWRDSLKVFNFGPPSPCPKCGALYAAVKYRSEIAHHADPQVRGAKDVLQRTCKDCEYIWYERPIG